MSENLLTASEVAKYLRVKTETVYKLIRNGDLPAARIGGQWRFREIELERWVEARMAPEIRQTDETSNGRALLAQEQPTGTDKL